MSKQPVPWAIALVSIPVFRNAGMLAIRSPLWRYNAM